MSVMPPRKVTTSIKPPETLEDFLKPRTEQEVHEDVRRQIEAQEGKDPDEKPTADKVVHIHIHHTR